LTITFLGPDGRIGSSHQVIQLQFGGILPQYYTPEAREKFLNEPGASVSRTVVGGEKNSVVIQKSKDSEISIVRDGIQYSFAYGHDSEMLRAIEMIKETARFPPPENALAELGRWSDPKAHTVTEVIRVNSPEEARDILTREGAPGVRVSGGTFHNLNSTQGKPYTNKKRWWQFWK